ncbi:hypothetical protein GUITHDRAFT_114981 [Guillardia theta CCMP2712]|uniref:Disease resistance R13L4/SHOC-2-like LRR domain-containing protein n=1 Tax=Guillardia theta (strain CCMP2712) TaxID=905079 RepID=L1ISR7_GUITC|nr:hypothetical protein GUITHDRAFT_114981 [Guillardia theta CCMP2712]EKX38875.1 hypothetical protein GUITHDRAFT_114981 [Guillardia theta CCMP2712]|eukprot:XP_005825855.1 hypothetical protein GUITHDRAFT_114981 [Guillardia theta CCMP2712]
MWFQTSERKYAAGSLEMQWRGRQRSEERKKRRQRDASEECSLGGEHARTMSDRNGRTGKMPVGRRELERWAAAQEAKKKDSGGLTGVFRSAHSNGNLNLADRNLDSVPELLLSWSAPIGDENWWEVSELKKLDLSLNALSNLPDDLFASFSLLQTLHVANNKLQTLPPSLTSCPELSKLNIQHNQFATLPGFVGHLSCLSSLQVDHNAIHTLPEEIGLLHNLDTFTCSNNQLQQLPSSLGHLTSLTFLNMSSNRIEAIPGTVGNLLSLTSLEASHNLLQSLPDGLRNLSNLTRLDVRENCLTSATSLPHAPRMSELLLGFNKIQTFPPNLGDRLKSLSVLDIRDNAISNLEASDLTGLKVSMLVDNLGAPSDIDMKLKMLDVRNNEIKMVPPELGLMTTLTSILLDGNPLKTMRRCDESGGTIITGTAREILEYLRSRIQQNPEEDVPTSGLTRDVAMTIRSSVGNGLLCLKGLQLQDFPYDCFNLSDSLKSLDFSDNNLESLSERCLSWTNLHTINLANNQLSRTEQASYHVLSNLPNLTSINLQVKFLCRLTAVPEDLHFATSLVNLDMSNNQIEVG